MIREMEAFVIPPMTFVMRRMTRFPGVVVSLLLLLSSDDNFLRLEGGRSEERK